MSSRSASSSRPGANRDYCRCTRGTSHALTPVCVVQECLELQAASTRCAGGGSADSSVNISGAGFSSIQLLRLTKCQQGSELLRAVSLALHALDRVCFVHRCLDLLPFLSTNCDLLCVLCALTVLGRRAWFSAAVPSLRGCLGNSWQFVFPLSVNIVLNMCHTPCCLFGLCDPGF